jgi:peptidoglycan-N-acetylglucosamine deacetylase
MPGPPPHIAARRARRRAQLRRQRLLALSATLAALMLLAIALIDFAAGAKTPLPRPGGGSSVSPPATRTAASHYATEQVDHRAPRTASATIARLLRLGLPIYCGGPHGNEVAFTFDDGPGIYTHYALKKLAEADERATFFDVGRSIDNWPGYLTRELKVGAVEDHTYTHVALIALTPSQITYQLQATAEKIQTDTGEHVQLWRPPYELHNATVDRIAQQFGLLDVLWDDDSQDSLGANYAQITKNVEAGLRPGAIIEMHENRGQTIRALTTLLPALHNRHLRSVSVPQLLASDPPSAEQVRDGLAGCKREGEVLTHLPAE